MLARTNFASAPPLCRGKRSPKAAFTLIELLTVLAIVGILSAIGLSAVQAAREAARRTQCANNLRQLGVASHSYVSANQEFPPGVKQWYFNSSVSHRGIPLFAYLLPFLEQGAVLTTWDYDDPMKNVDRGRQSPTANVLSVLLCPNDVIDENPVTVPGRGWAYALTSYGGNGGTRSYFPERSTADGMFHTTWEASEPQRFQRPVRPADVRDGLGQTLLFGERTHADENYESFNAAGWGENLRQWGWWGASTSRKMIGHVTMSAFAPINYQLPFAFDERAGQDPPADSFAAFQEYVERRLCAFGSGHPGGANFCIADGSLRFMTADTDPETLKAWSTRAATDGLENQ
ncbi:MAG: DUF1559 domain-containing protein [Planctomycetota bacterium]